MHKISGLLVGLAVSAASIAASAQQGKVENIGNGGGIVIGAERLVGVYHTTTTTDTTADQSGTGFPFTVESEIETSQTTFAVFGHDPASVTQIPRVSLDYMPVRGFSLGGSFMYLRTNSEVEGERTATSSGTSQTIDVNGKLTESAIVVNPRIGYAAAFNEYVGLWPRVGFSYSQTEQVLEDTALDPTTGNEQTFEQTTTVSLTHLTLEGLLFVSPFTGFAFVGGPFADIGIDGTTETESDQPNVLEDSGDAKTNVFGFMIGVAGYFDTQ